MTSPLSEFERALIEVACQDADYGDADSVRRSYLAYRPRDLADLSMATLRAQIDDWIPGRRAHVHAQRRRQRLAILARHHHRSVGPWRADQTGRVVAGVRGLSGRGRGHPRPLRLWALDRRARSMPAAWDGVTMARVISRTRGHERRAKREAKRRERSGAQARPARGETAAGRDPALPPTVPSASAAPRVGSNRHPRRRRSGDRRPRRRRGCGRGGALSDRRLRAGDARQGRRHGPRSTNSRTRTASRRRSRIEAKMAAERKAAEQRRQFGAQRDRYEVREMLWRFFQEARRYLRRSAR